MIYTVQRLGESCIDSRQCKEAIPYSMCDADTYCECQQGYLELNSSCLPGKPVTLLKCNLNALNNASHRLTVILIYVFQLKKCTFSFYIVQQLKESCIFHKQCLVANPNTTCDNLTGICKCSDGHLEMFNTCFESNAHFL